MRAAYAFSGTKAEEEGLVFCVLTPVPEAVARCQSAGIMMVTGDHPVTAKAIAQKVGIIDERSVTAQQVADENYGGDVSRVGADEYNAIVVAGSELQRQLDRGDENPQGEDFWNNALNKENRMFARTSPQQKLLIVSAVQARDGNVAVAGDGVNDSPAKKADIGVAMGTGTEVAKEAVSAARHDYVFEEKALRFETKPMGFQIKDEGGKISVRSVRVLGILKSSLGPFDIIFAVPTLSTVMRTPSFSASTKARAKPHTLDIVTPARRGKFELQLENLEHELGSSLKLLRDALKSSTNQIPTQRQLMYQYANFLKRHKIAIPELKASMQGNDDSSSDAVVGTAKVADRDVSVYLLVLDGKHISYTKTLSDESHVAGECKDRNVLETYKIDEFLFDIRLGAARELPLIIKNYIN